MPELPEVETVVRDLRPRLRGRRIAAVTIGPKQLRFPWRIAWTTLVAGRHVMNLSRRGKWIIIDLDAGHLLVHLGMTGQLRVVPSEQPPQPHTHLAFDLGGGRELRFRDVRRFGSIRWCPAAEDVERLIGEDFGPEPWDLQPEDWFRRLRRSRRALKAILLDQTVVAGIGNIYADESLFAAGLSPRQRGLATTRQQAEQLRRAIIAVLDRAIAGRGTTIRDYLDGSGRRGRYQRKLLVYGRTGQPCVGCGTAIRRIRLAGRSTHYCPRCQSPKREQGNRRAARRASNRFGFQS